MSFYPEKGGRGVNPSRPKAARARQLKDGVKARTPQSWNSANSGPPAGCPRFRAGLSALTWVVANPSFVCLGGAVQVLESAIHFAYLGASSTISRHYVPWGLKRFHAGLCAHPEDWEWSSFRHYATGSEEPVEIESEWTARRRERLRGQLCRNCCC